MSTKPGSPITVTGRCKNSVLERRTANPGISWVQKENPEKAQDANVVGAGNLNVRNQ